MTSDRIKQLAADADAKLAIWRNISAQLSPTNSIERVQQQAAYNKAANASYEADKALRIALDEDRQYGT